VICLDTGGVIAAVQETDLRPDQAEHRRRIIPYLDTHRANRRILIPSVALAEFIYGLSRAEWARVTADVAGEDFLIAPFDLRAALRASEIRRDIIGSLSEREAIRDAGTVRTKFRADYQVLATALVHGATVFLTTDPTLAGHARRYGLRPFLLDELPAPPPPAPPAAIPPPRPQPQLFSDGEDGW
jgi:predicted nucleic acid-binding protein